MAQHHSAHEVEKMFNKQLFDFAVTGYTREFDKISSRLTPMERKRFTDKATGLIEKRDAIGMARLWIELLCH